MNKITTVQFLGAFTKVWKDFCSKYNPGDIAEEYKSNTRWTSLLLGNKAMDGSCLLQAVCDGLEIPDMKYRREYYTLDALFVGGDSLLPWDKCLGYPKNLYCLIEHENGEWVEEEMWKLIFWRSPLKVLIFYDLWEGRKQADKFGISTCDDKLAALRAMLKHANAFHPEAADTEYVFLVGNLPATTAGEAPLPQWRYATNRDWELKPLITGVH